MSVISVASYCILCCRRESVCYFKICQLYHSTSALTFLCAHATPPGIVIPLLGQMVLFWQVLLALTVLKRRLSRAQVFGVALVLAGVSAAAWPSGGASPMRGVRDIGRGRGEISVLLVHPPWPMRKQGLFLSSHTS